MSHMVKIELEINNLEALKKACQRLGLVWKQNQQEAKWFGGEPFKCDHAISIPDKTGMGYGYEIGVVKEGAKFRLEADFFDKNLQAKIGTNGGLLKQAYAIERAKAEAVRKGYSVKEFKTANGIQLRVQVGG